MLQAECEGGAGCSWCYTGQGWHYQLLAGPGFIVVFTVAGVAWGFLADRWGSYTGHSEDMLLRHHAVVCP